MDKAAETCRFLFFSLSDIIKPEGGLGPQVDSGKAFGVSFSFQNGTSWHLFGW